MLQRNRRRQLPLPRSLRVLRGLLRELPLLAEVLEDQVDRPGLPLALGELHDPAAPHATAGLRAAGGVLEDARVALEGREGLAEVEAVAVEGAGEERVQRVFLEEGERFGGRWRRRRGRGNGGGRGCGGTQTGKRSVENRGSDFVVVDVAFDTLDVLELRELRGRGLHRGKARRCKTTLGRSRGGLCQLREKTHIPCPGAPSCRDERGSSCYEWKAKNFQYTRNGAVSKISSPQNAHQKECVSTL